MRDRIHYGTSTIDFDLTFAERKTMGVRVEPDGEVFVVAPLGTQTDKVRDKVLSKAAWIRRQRDYFLAFYPRRSERRYVSGETHYYLGKQYRLKVHGDLPDVPEGVKLSAGYLHLTTGSPQDANHSRELLNAWYLRQAERHFPTLLAARLPRARTYYTGPVELRWRWLKNRWGTCSRSGVITLNLELIKAPTVCIEYVIVHELCHLKHFHHGKEFYALLEREWPGWEVVKERLERLLA
ncbi:M48 family metallopeptidase [Lewinella sp. IMCC34183]|uniref:M48 family metallopeptidase n=1 Tax=Lewinella sp. IMCC34183 TaxID=2248762 RepID=UPI000E24FB1E|nr:SprT family zinc-dependent metalloprotease [Lewinella sp. IMCC34183]